MSATERRTFLKDAATAVLTTLGRDGFPHSTAMWFLPGDDSVRMWTYRKSQKAVNLERDPRCAILIEQGEDYASLRGLLVRAEARMIHDTGEIAQIGRALYLRYTLPKTGIAYEEGPRLEVERQARKRVGLEIPFTKITTWDHSKL